MSVQPDEQVPSKDVWEFEWYDQSLLVVIGKLAAAFRFLKYWKEVMESWSTVAAERVRFCLRLESEFWKLKILSTWNRDDLWVMVTDQQLYPPPPKTFRSVLWYGAVKIVLIAPLNWKWSYCISISISFPPFGSTAQLFKLSYCPQGCCGSPVQYKP